MGFTSCKAEQPLRGMELQKKKSPKRLQHTGNLFIKNLQLKDDCNSRLKTTKIIGQKKTFYRQRIPESSCARKETVDRDILVTSRNGDRKIMQSLRITSRPPSRKRKWSQLSQFWRTSNEVIPSEKTSAGHISTMRQGFKRSSKWRTNSTAYPFL